MTAPTKDDCAFEASKLKKEGLPPDKGPGLTVGQAVDQYIESCATLSPTTISGYKKIRRTCFPDLMDAEVSELSAPYLQAAINAEIKRKTSRRTNLSPKTIRNAYGLISAALRYAGEPIYSVKLPKDDPKFLELPDPSEVMDAVSGSDVELPCMLALWLSLSMSEVRGLKYSSIRHGCIYIDQVIVDVDGKPTVKKRAKVASRNRCLTLPSYLEALIIEKTDLQAYQKGEISDDFLVKQPGYIIQRHFEKLMPGMTFHKLRHLNASVMLQLGVPDKYAMERGGWSTPHVMKSVYQHTFSDARKGFDQSIDEYFLTKISHESTH